MVVDALFGAVQGLLTWLAGLFPSWSLPNPLEAWGSVMSNLTALNYFLPIAEVFTVTLSVFVLFPALMGVSLLAWIVALIRGGSSRG